MDEICFLKAKRDYLDLFNNASVEFAGYIPHDKYLKRQLIFMGYVPLSEYKVRSKYCYFITNRMIEGEYWIYPQRFSDNYKTLQKGKYPYFQDYLGLYGLPGITRTKFSNERI